MSEIVDFLKTNAYEILTIVIVIVCLLVLINLKGLDLNAPKPETKLVQEVTVETFDTEDNINNTIHFCESYLGNAQELEGACNQLTESNCAKVKCCGFAKSGENGKCVAGGLDGPTYKTDKDGKLITIDTYYYLNKCRGSLCP